MHQYGPGHVPVNVDVYDEGPFERLNVLKAIIIERVRLGTIRSESGADFHRNMIPEKGHIGSSSGKRRGYRGIEIEYLMHELVQGLIECRVVGDQSL